MTPHRDPMWLHALTRKNMGSASEIDVEMTVEYVAVPTTGCATPLTSSVEYSGSSWSEKVDENFGEGERGRVAEEGVEDDRHVLARALEVRGVARRRSRCRRRPSPRVPSRATSP